MLERPLYEQYRIDLKHVMNIGNDLIIDGSGEKYLIRYCSALERRKISEQFEMAQFLTYHGDPDVVLPIKTVNGHESTTIDGEEAIVYQFQGALGDDHVRSDEDQSIGRRLARFHLLGEPYEPATSSNWRETWLSWKNRWIKRLDQLENWYVRKQQDPVKSEIDEIFLLSFPYFLGITENAIQMISDLQLNDPFSIREVRGNTVCHFRFHEGCWLTLDEQRIARYKVPADFVYDHFSRDVSEYVRHICLEDLSYSKKIKRIETFLHRYQSIRPFQKLDVYLFLIRTTFPVHYFDQIEAYYRTIDQKQKALLESDITSLFMQTEEYEYLLRHLSRLFFSRDPYLPEWLSKRT